jgi:hypothetical protein
MKVFNTITGRPSTPERKLGLAFNWAKGLGRNRRVGTGKADYSAITFLLAALILSMNVRCSDFVQPQLAMDTNPVLPPVDNVYIYAGIGTDSIVLQMRMDNVERILGRPLTSNTGAGLTTRTYALDDVAYTVYYQNYQVSGMIITCDRYVALVGNTIAAQYYENKAGLIANIGQPTRDESFTWYYDTKGIAFEYDNNTQRVTGVYVYPPSSGLAKYFWFSRVWASDTVDDNHNGYAQQFRLNYDIDCSITDAGDSLDVYILYKGPSDTVWKTMGAYSAFVNGASSLDTSHVTINGASDETVFDFKLVAVYQGTLIEAISYLRGMKMESATQDQ